MFECRIKVSNSEQSYTKKSIQYEENVVIAEDSPLILELVNKAKSEFKGDVEDVKVTITMTFPV